MKSYPSISHIIQMGLPIYAFDKIDGSNIRVEWSKRKGLYKFGSRRRLLSSESGILNKAEILIRNKEDLISGICRRNKWDRALFFFEFAGPNSEFGSHDLNDNHDVWLIDVSPYKKGILPPKDFINLFSELNPAPLLYRGNCNNGFVSSVKDGSLKGMGPEGVVCKVKGRGNEIVMFKIKSESWYLRLRDFCNGDERKFEELK